MSIIKKVKKVNNHYCSICKKELPISVPPYIRKALAEQDRLCTCKLGEVTPCKTPKKFEKAKKMDKDEWETKGAEAKRRKFVEKVIQDFINDDEKISQLTTLTFAMFKLNKEELDELQRFIKMVSENAVWKTIWKALFDKRLKAHCSDLKCYNENIEDCIKQHPENVVVNWKNLMEIMRT